jgi:hypothetical protein
MLGAKEITSRKFYNITDAFSTDYLIKGLDVTKKLTLSKIH